MELYVNVNLNIKVFITTVPLINWVLALDSIMTCLFLLLITDTFVILIHIQWRSVRFFSFSLESWRETQIPSITAVLSGS